MKTEVSKYLAKIAKKGGKSGRGAAKRRTREQCQAAAQAMHAKRRAKSAANRILAKLDREARADRCKGDIVSGWDWPTLAIVKPLEYNRLRELNEQHKQEFRSLRAAGLLPLKNN